MGGGGMEVVKTETIYTYHNTVIAKMTTALRRAATRVKFECFINFCQGQVHKTVSTKQQPFLGERRAEAESSRGPSTKGSLRSLLLFPVPNKP